MAIDVDFAVGACLVLGFKLLFWLFRFTYFFLFVNSRDFQNVDLILISLIDLVRFVPTDLVVDYIGLAVDHSETRLINRVVEQSLWILKECFNLILHIL